MVEMNKSQAYITDSGDVRIFFDKEGLFFQVNGNIIFESIKKALAYNEGVVPDFYEEP